VVAAGLSFGQQAAPAAPDTPPGQATPERFIATVAVQEVSVSGSLVSVANGRASIGNNGTITAGDSSADVALTRGGSLKLCATTKIHLTTDNSAGSSGAGGPLMISLDRGALEAHYTPGQYSDVLLTPDLRILVSGPGQADISMRVNSQGDTCVDNHGDQAPYVLASNLFEGGVYRVQANQRVLFEHGSVAEVVDNEPEPCGCPPPQSVATTGTPGASPALPGQAVAPNPTATQNPFPLAESEGLKPPPPTPAVPPGEVHAEVTAPLTYDANHPSLPPATTGAAGSGDGTAPIPVPTSAIHVAQAALPPPPRPRPTGFFGHIGHFFKRLFGGS
jgi:hypothetical protein